jgi:hypothetical protein
VEITGSHDDFSLILGNAFDGVTPFAGDFDSSFYGFCTAVHGQASFRASHIRELLVEDVPSLSLRKAREVKLIRWSGLSSPAQFWMQ